MLPGFTLWGISEVIAKLLRQTMGVRSLVVVVENSKHSLALYRNPVEKRSFSCFCLLLDVKFYCLAAYDGTSRVVKLLRRNKADGHRHRFCSGGRRAPTHRKPYCIVKFHPQDEGTPLWRLTYDSCTFVCTVKMRIQNCSRASSTTAHHLSVTVRITQVLCCLLSAPFHSVFFRLAAIGYDVGALREDDIGYLLENWKFGTPNMSRYIFHILHEARADRACVRGIYETSAGGVADRSSKPVAYSFTFPHGAISALTTLPGHRRKGLARTIVQLYVAWCVDKGIAPVCFIEDGNKVSVSLFLKLGFRQVHGARVSWFYHNPANPWWSYWLTHCITTLVLCPADTYFS